MLPYLSCKGLVQSPTVEIKGYEKQKDKNDLGREGSCISIGVHAGENMPISCSCGQVKESISQSLSSVG